MTIRNISASSIQYIVIQDANQKPVSGMEFIANPTNQIFHELISYPRDFMQFHNQTNYVKISKAYKKLNHAINCLILPGENINFFAINEYSKLLGLKNRTCVYFVDGNCKNLAEILKIIKQINHSSWFFNIYNSVSIKEYEKEENFFLNSVELIDLFKTNFSNIKKNLIILGEGYKDIDFNLDNSEDNEYNFNQLIPNYQTKYQLEKKHWKYKPLKCNQELSFENRHIEVIKLIEEIDNLHIAKNKELDINDTLPILITVFPFIEPSTNEILKSQNDNIVFNNIAKNILLEQKKDYSYEILANNQNEAEFAQRILLSFVMPKFKLIDSISYLHSSFTFSPIIRFPLLGKSIYKELNFLNPKHNFFDSPKSIKNKIKSIQIFGKRIEEILIDENTNNYLQKRNGQILAISDLPIEWLSLNNIPLAFTHDIARIQESNYQGNINNYSANNRLEFEINKNILKKTLIILSDDANVIENHEFKTTYKIVENASKDLEFHYRYCRNKLDVSKAIEEIEPYLLIFDCHGNIDDEKGTSYLLINNERIYGEDIIKYKISAPIVYLSCCNSNPNHGFIRKLHDAFFQTGAISVTGTFHPISIKRGTMYYIRMLNLLKLETNKSVFKNWLQFISHIIRSSVIHDVIEKAHKTLKRTLTENESRQLSAVLFEIMIFEKRREIFEKLLNGGIKISDELNLKIQDTESEMLMYTHYGRPDLIYFE